MLLYIFPAQNLLASQENNLFLNSHSNSVATTENEYTLDRQDKGYRDFNQDINANLYYLHARYYDQNTRQFLTKDPAGMKNLYAYCAKDPVNNIDPKGLEPIWKDILKKVSNFFDNITSKIEPICNSEFKIELENKQELSISKEVPQEFIERLNKNQKIFKYCNEKYKEINNEHEKLENSLDNYMNSIDKECLNLTNEYADKPDIIDNRTNYLYALSESADELKELVHNEEIEELNSIDKKIKETNSLIKQGCLNQSKYKKNIKYIENSNKTLGIKLHIIKENNYINKYNQECQELNEKFGEYLLCSKDEEVLFEVEE